LVKKSYPVADDGSKDTRGLDEERNGTPKVQQKLEDLALLDLSEFCLVFLFKFFLSSQKKKICIYTIKAVRLQAALCLCSRQASLEVGLHEGLELIAKLFGVLPHCKKERQYEEKKKNQPLRVSSVTYRLTRQRARRL